MEYKFGYVAVLGRPNAGKSTLINNLVKNKVAIVSPKPQTTRNNILGILTKQDFQLVFVDTPGIHKSKNALDKYMMKNVRSAIGGANVMVYLIDATKKIKDDELDYIKNLKQKNEESKLIVCLSKIDLVQKANLLPLLSQVGAIAEIDDLIPLSSVKTQNTDTLLNTVLSYLPASKEKNFEYDDEYYTDKSLRFIASETIREKALYLLQDEIPHGISVNITTFDEKHNLVIIEADIVCERESHKSIIIGKRGVMLKNIGQQARHDLEVLIGKQILLKLFVKSKKNWREDTNFLTEFGYKNEDQ